VDPKASMPTPPPFGTPVTLPKPPSPKPAPNPLPPPPTAKPLPVGKVLLRGGGTLPPPNDQPLPQQPNPPTNG
jgi:hypothetical protein